MAAFDGNEDVVPFRIEVQEDALNDLRARLSGRTKAVPQDLVTMKHSREFMSAGSDAYALEELLEYWENEYDWRQHEAELNSFAQFKTKIENVDLHFIHERNPNLDAIPILLVHGWPGGVYEFHNMIPMLQAQGDRFPFHIVAPSLPGYAWSTVDNGSGANVITAARVFNKLMGRLGYKQYVVQGGDWGSLVVNMMAREFPRHVVAQHVNMPFAVPDKKVTGRSLYFSALAVRDTFMPSLALDSEDQQAIACINEYSTTGSAYFLFQATKPELLGVALNDSPAALASWFLEKYWAWTDRCGSADPALTKDQMLTNLSIYWHTQSIASSMRFYFETVPITPGTSTVSLDKAGYISVPTGVGSFPKEILRTPKQWMKLACNVQHWQRFTKGGHFAAWEQPSALASDISTFFHHVLDFEAEKVKARSRSPGDAPVDEQIPVKTLFAFAATGGALMYLLRARL